MATTKKPKLDEYTVIRDLIVRGSIQPRERLVEMDYAEKLGTNRANIRRALARLEQEGLVVCEPFRGAHVRYVTEDEAIEIFEVRGVLEVLLVPRAVERATKEDKDQLNKLLRELHGHVDKQDNTMVGLGSRSIREQLWRISGHATGLRILNTLNSNLVRLWFQAIQMPGRPQEILTHLTAVVEAVNDGDADKAVRAMRQYHKAAVTAVKKATARVRERQGEPMV